MGVKKQNCEVLRHEASVEIRQGAGTFTYFKDLTGNHYKALVDVFIETTDLSEFTGAQLIVAPRMGDNFIVNIPPNSSGDGTAAIQIEDARSVSLIYTGSKQIVGTMNIIKDFCICCPNCGEIRSHEGTFNFSRNFSFTDITANHYKAMVVVKLDVAPTDSSTGQIIVTPPPAGMDSMTDIPPGGQVAIQIEDADELTVASTTAASPTSPSSIHIIKDYCIYCP